MSIPGLVTNLAKSSSVSSRTRETSSKDNLQFSIPLEIPPLLFTHASLFYKNVQISCSLTHNLNFRIKKYPLNLFVNKQDFPYSTVSID